MAWKKSDGTIVKAGRSWVDDNNIRHPTNWMIWSDDYKKSFGLTWEDDVDTSYDNRFYWSKGVERKLEDKNEVDEDGNALINPVTGKQLVTLGLKSIWITKTKTTANSLLSKTDWYVTRKTEADTAIPSDITKYRADVRTATATIETKINNCSKLSEFIALFDVPLDSDGNVTGNAPIHDFPDEV